jgi:hypothetical protein
MRPINDPGAKFFSGEQQLSQKKENSEGEGLLKLPQLRKSQSEAFGSFFLMISTSCLDKPSDKTLLGLSTVTTGPTAVNLTMIY